MGWPLVPTVEKGSLFSCRRIQNTGARQKEENGITGGRGERLWKGTGEKRRSASSTIRARK
jgi:hypothetical protein